MTRPRPAPLVAACLIASVTSAAGAPDVSVQHLDERLHAFLLEVRCLVCQNETLAESRAELAVDLRREVRKQMEAGRSDDEIRTFLTDRYGDFVLYRPPFQPATYPLWLGPFVLLGGGLLVLYRQIGRHPGSVAVPARARIRARRLLRTTSRLHPVSASTEANLAAHRHQYAELEADYRAGILTEHQWREECDELEGRLAVDLAEAPPLSKRR